MPRMSDQAPRLSSICSIVLSQFREAITKRLIPLNLDLKYSSISLRISISQFAHRSSHSESLSRFTFPQAYGICSMLNRRPLSPRRSVLIAAAVHCLLICNPPLEILSARDEELVHYEQVPHHRLSYISITHLYVHLFRAWTTKILRPTGHSSN